MPIVETSHPCFVCRCDNCGRETYPPSSTRFGSENLATREHGYRRLTDGTWRCGECKRIGTMTKRLSDAQWRLLNELAEPNNNADGMRFFPAKNLRTLQSLAIAGLAKVGEWDLHRYGFSITELGRGTLRVRDDA